MNKKDIIKKVTKPLAVVIVVVVVINAIPFFRFMKPVQFIKSDILLTTPIGMGIDKVFEVLNGNERWLNVRRIGEQSITSYQYDAFPYISVSWEFNENGELVEVFVKKEWSP